MAGSYKIFKTFFLLFALFRVGHPQDFDDISQNFCDALSNIPDNLSCPNVAIEAGACFTRDLLCNGIVDCIDQASPANNGADEGVNSVFSALECELFARELATLQKSGGKY